MVAEYHYFGEIMLRTATTPAGGVVTKTPYIPTGLRIPPALHRKLAARAEREHRSLNSLLLHLIEQALRDEPDLTQKEDEPDHQP